VAGALTGAGGAVGVGCAAGGALACGIGSAAGALASAGAALCSAAGAGWLADSELGFLQPTPQVTKVAEPTRSQEQRRNMSFYFAQDFVPLICSRDH